MAKVTRSSWVGGATVVVILLGVIGGGAWYLNRDTAPPSAAVTKVEAAQGSSPKMESQQSTTNTVPAYLPQDASIDSTSHVPAQIVGSASEPARTDTYLSLSGPANKDTVQTSQSLDRSGATHTGTDITIGYVADQTVLPPGPPADDAYFGSSSLDIGGNVARYTYPKNGYGPFKYEWIDQDGYHEVLCDRLTTSDGPSGVTTADLLKIADSLYPS
jgi:hypothetical protein